MKNHRLFYLLLSAFLACTAACAEEIPRAFGNGSSISHYVPPPHLSRAQMPRFERGELKSTANSLDQFDWTFTQLLYDADTTSPYYEDTLNAVPTGILLYPVDERAYISTFHTIFFSEDGGFTWENGDPNPIPNYSWHFRFVRRPNYIYGLAANSTVPSQMDKNYTYIVHLNSRTYKGFARQAMFTTPQLAFVGQDTLKMTDYWLGHIILPDTVRMSLLGSLDGYTLFSQRLRADTLDTTIWSETHLDPFNWVTGPLAYVNGFLYAAGSHQWVSRDSGRTWEVRPSADEIFDGGVAFVDTLFGWTGGGRISPLSEGWVHRTTDGGHTWSERLLETDYPIRTVHFLDRQIGFAAGGNYEEGIGGIWSTTDGGESWREDMTVSAEITVLGSRRRSPAYVDVFAAGFFPDFVGGVWHRRLFVPDTTEAVLVARPDTLDFGALLPGDRDTLSFWLFNYGSRADTITYIYVTDTVFAVLSDTLPFEMAPRDSIEIPVEFKPRAFAAYLATVDLFNSSNQDVHIVCRGEGRDLDAQPPESLIPQEASVSVYPNPGNPDFTVSFALPTRADIHISVYNILGQRVAVLASGPHDAGSHRLIWQADALPSGIYFVRLEGILSPKITKLCLLR